MMIRNILEIPNVLALLALTLLALAFKDENSFFILSTDRMLFLKKIDFCYNLKLLKIFRENKLV